MLFDILSECNSVISVLYLSYNQLDDECMKQLGEYVQDNQHLEELSINSNKITDKGIEILSEYLIGNISLKEMKTSFNNGITDTSVPHLIEIAKRSCITMLEMNYISISKENMQEIRETLSIPIEQREIPINSNSKSAAKVGGS